MISAVEKTASQYARQLDAVITQLMQPRSKWREKSLAAAVQLVSDIKALLDNTDPQLIHPSPYFQFLLQQCSRYNAFFYRYSFATHSVANLNRPRELQPIQVAAIPILNQALHFQVNTAMPAQEIFRPAHVAKDQNQKDRYFYDANDEAGFIELYDNANKKIGLLTQSSNVRKHVKNAGKAVSTLFTGARYGQGADQYFSDQEEQSHPAALKQYQMQTKDIELGMDLTKPAEENAFYKRPIVTEVPPDTKITHIGHATALVQNGAFNLVTDPVHYQSATEGLISLAARVFYARQTQAAIDTKRYPGVHVVWISHNHHDHLCKKSLQEAFPLHTLFIVPIGDAIHLKRFGFHNVIEVAAWGQSVTLTNTQNNEALVVHSIPAKHASNRMLNDYMHSLYNGCIIEYQRAEKKSLALVSGDTAVLDSQHYTQLAAFIKELNAPVTLACIASGPDRPRSLMDCTHQSSVDAMVVQARLTNANLQHRIIPIEQLYSHCNHTIAYHQGCFRLGLLTFADVNSTLYRMLGLLDSYQACHPASRSISDLWNDLTQDLQFRKNIYYCVMDNFERAGILNLVNEYGKVRIQDNNAIRTLTVDEFATLLQNTFHVPQIGESFSFNERRQQCKPRLQLHSEKLLVNTSVKEYLLPVFDEFAADDQLHELMLNLYYHFESLSHHKNKKISFAAWLTQDTTEKLWTDYNALSRTHERNALLHKILCDVHLAVQGKERFDETHHEAGNFETIILLFAVLKLHGGKVILRPTPVKTAASVDDDNDDQVAVTSHR